MKRFAMFEWVKYISIKRLFLIIMLSFLFLPSFCQVRKSLQEQYRFNAITVDDGLNNNRVRAVVQDKYGFIWFGTRTGISKYDGYKMTNYNYYFTDSSEERFKQIRELISDSYGNLWAGGEYGIFIYNPTFDRFDILEDPDYPGRITKTTGISEDHDGVIWFTNAHEICNYNPLTKKYTYFSSASKEPGALPEGSPEKILVDKYNNVWIGYQNEGLAYYERNKNTFTHFIADGNRGSLGENLIERLYEDDAGNIWIGFNNKGFSKFSRDTWHFITYFPDNNDIESGRVRGILKDIKGNFWIGTMAGLYLFDEFNEKFQLYAHISHPVSELSHNSIQCIYQDNHEGLWMGTHAGGVCYTNLNTSGFVRYDYSSIPSPYFLNDKNVYSLAVNHDGNMWIGTEKGGLNFLDRATGKFTSFVTDPQNKNTVLSNNIKDIIVDDLNNIWFATYGGGFSYYDTENNKFTHFLRSEQNPDGFPINRIYSLYIDPLDDELLWLGTISGLYLYNIQTKKYVKISPENSEYTNAPETNSQINTFNHCQNKLIIGTNSLIILDLVEKNFNTLTSIAGISISSVNFIHIDKKGYIWFDINNSYLVRSDPDFNEQLVFSTENGLPDLNFYEAGDDNMGNLWLSTNKGIVQLQNIINNQDTIIQRIFTKSDNLQSIEFLYHSKAVSPEGEIFFGGINGFNSFIPEKVVTNPYSPRVHVIGIEVGNEPVEVFEKIFGRVLLDKPIIEEDFIKIHHRIKGFTIRFVGLHYISPENNRYAYMLEGHDDDWNVTASSVRFASYSNLHGGTYYFKVKAANNSGIWTEEETVLTIKVVPPFWKTWWFYLAASVFILMLVFFLIKQREMQLKKDKINLEKKLEEGEIEINKRKSEIEQHRKAIEEKEKAEEINRWFNEGLAVFSDIINKEKGNLKKLTQMLISNLVKYLEAQQGGIYVSENNGEDHVQIQLMANYAFNVEKLEKVSFSPGEGLIGTSFQQKEMVELDDLPATYAKLNSGLGVTSLKYLLIIPLIYDNESVGVIEIASLDKLEKSKIDFLNKVSESIASVISSVRSNNLINEMLIRTQEQSEELHAQEEEMKQTIEEMKATQDDIHLRETDLHNQLNSLKQQVTRLTKINEDQKNKIHKLSHK